MAAERVEPAQLGVSVDVFGPTRLQIDGGAVPTGRPQVDLLLVGLVAERSATVSSDALIEHLWSDTLPRHPRKALNVTLSRLRQALGPYSDRLVADGSGYRLIAAVDLDQFEDLVELGCDGTWPDRVSAFEMALALRRDSPFSSASEAALVAPRRARTIALERSARVQLAELLVDRDRHDDALSVVRGLEAEAVDERVVIVVARALARSGRRSEALAAIKRSIDRLHDAGLETSSVLRQVEREILTEAVDVHMPKAVSAASTPHAFVGRDRELEMLGRVGNGDAIELIAEAGMGKSALLDKVAESQEGAERRVVRINVSPAPLRPMDTAAQLCLSVLSSLMPADVGAEFHGAIHRMCPEVEGFTGGAVSRDSLIDDVTRFVEHHAAGSVLLIDDGQWIDGGSASVVEQLVESGRVAVVVARRPSNGSWRVANHERPRAARKSIDRWRMVDLARFEVNEVVTMMQKASDRPAPLEVAERFHELSGGNGLMLRLLIDGWIDGVQLDSRLPSSVLLAVTQRLDVLSQPARATLDVAACLGTRFDVGQLVNLRAAAKSHLSEAEDAGLVAMDSDAVGGQFRHALVADACRQLVPPGQLVALHDDIGRLLELRDGPASEIARHFTAAAVLDPYRAILASLRASAEFAGGFDWENARLHAEAAAAVATEYRVADDVMNAEIIVRRGIIERALGDDRYVDRLIAGCDSARAVGHDELFVVAVTELSEPGATSKARTVDERVHRLLDEALALDVPPAVRAELCASSVRLLGSSDQRYRGRQLFREAWQIVQDLGDVDVEIAVLLRASGGFSHPDDSELFWNSAQRLTELAEHQSHLTWDAAAARFICAIVRADHPLAKAALDAMRTHLDRVVGQRTEVTMEFYESVFAMMSGDLEVAERHAERVQLLGLERFDPSWARLVHGMLLLGLRWEQGRLDERRAYVEAGVARTPSYLPSRAVAALIATETGEFEAARRHLDVFWSQGVDAIYRNMTHTSMLVASGHAVAAVGTSDEINTLFDLLVPYSGRVSWNTPSACGVVDRALGALAGARGDHVAAERFALAADQTLAAFRGEPT